MNLLSNINTFLSLILCNNQLHNGVMAKTLDCGLEVSEFELQLYYYI